MSHSNPQITAFREQILNAAKNKTPLSIEGGGTKSWYGNPNSHAKLDTRAYSGILEYKPEELVITACAGTPLKEIEAALKEKNQVLAFEPPHFGESATFGGAIAAGLAGPGRITVGNFRDFVLGARILDGKGQDLSFGGKVMKNVAGYDVSRLLPGSLGTLALLLEASVKVLPKPAATATLRCQISQEKAPLEEESLRLKSQGSFLDVIQKQRLDVLAAREKILTEASAIVSRNAAAFARGESPWTYSTLGAEIQEKENTESAIREQAAGLIASALEKVLNEKFDEKKDKKMIEDMLSDLKA